MKPCCSGLWHTAEESPWKPATLQARNGLTSGKRRSQRDCSRKEGFGDVLGGVEEALPSRDSQSRSVPITKGIAGGQRRGPRVMEQQVSHLGGSKAAPLPLAPRATAIERPLLNTSVALPPGPSSLQKPFCACESATAGRCFCPSDEILGWGRIDVCKRDFCSPLGGALGCEGGLGQGSSLGPAWS